MDTKKILLISVIVVAILTSIGAVSAGLLDGLFGGELQDNVIEIDNITFNTTNVTKFVLCNETDGYKWYMDENRSGYSIHIFDLDEFKGIPKTPETEDAPSQTVNGIVVYTKIANMSGQVIGEPRYVAYIQNEDLNKLVDIWSPDPNETAKMALSLKFK